MTIATPFAAGSLAAAAVTTFGTTRTLYYRYDQAGRLYGVKLNADTLATYAYDLNGNRIAVKTVAGTDSATYDEQDRLISRGVMASGYTRYTYTAAGELQSRTVGSAVTQYVYDPLGNLVSVTLPNGDVVSYAADGSGRRVGRKLNGSWSAGWVYRNGLNVVADLDGAGAVVNRYVYGVSDQVPALILNGANTYRVITDQLGSVRAVVNVASGAVAQQTDYDAWGVPSVVSGGSFQVLGYAGGLSDASTGLVRFGARDYDPVAGRWTSRDPIGFGGGEGNLYAYVASEPINSIDSRGMIRDAGDEGPRLPKDSRQPCLTLPAWKEVLSTSLAIKHTVGREAAARAFVDLAAKDAWMHAEAAHRIANEFGPRTAFMMGVYQEYWSAVESVLHQKGTFHCGPIFLVYAHHEYWSAVESVLHQKGTGTSSADTEHDYMNNWQGLSYGMGGDELLKRGMLLKSPTQRVPPE